MSTAVQHAALRLNTAYGVCRHIARSSAKNFYYGFMLLPARKRVQKSLWKRPETLAAAILIAAIALNLFFA